MMSDNNKHEDDDNHDECDDVDGGADNQNEYVNVPHYYLPFS